ncbi:hypothetical protein [Pendulispora albinea]|uniref:Uncharacterized protein n=1 Tax=Pendulispora albinea TaxID=2741071 RepID=A0ABZ2LTI1_9BACT
MKFEALLTLLGMLGVLTFSSPVRAASPVRVHFAPNSVCNDEAAFSEHLRARDLEAVQAPDAPAYEVEIDVRSTGLELEGRLALTTGEEAPATRTVAAATCDEMWSTFALTLGLALAQLPDAPPPSPPAPPLLLPAPAPASPSPLASAARVPVRPSWKVIFGFGASSRVQWGVGPDFAPALGGFGQIEVAREGTMVAPRVRLGAYSALPASEQAREGVRAEYGLQWGELEVCPFRLFASVSAALRTCARMQVGRMQVEIANAWRGRSMDALWAAAELALSAEVRPVRFLFLELQGGVGPALARPSFSEDGASFSVPEIVGQVGISAGVHFP